MILTLIKIVLFFIPLLLSVAYLTLVERKVIAAMQRRLGPNVVGFYGLLQPFADGLKLLTKEIIIPYNLVDKTKFVQASLLTFLLSMVIWAVVPFNGHIFSDINLGLFYIFAISSLGVYGIILAGWASNSIYAFLGGLRSAAQLISYEISLGLTLLSILIFTQSLNLTDIIISQEYTWFFKPFFPLFIIFFITALAETNRPPFDLPEAEAELVAGFFVEYSAMGFALFFLGEMSNIIFMSTLTVILFLGGPAAPISILNFVPGIFWFVAKILFIVFGFIWVRAAYPRFRYDQLMYLGWKVFLPLSLGFFIFYSCFYYIFLI